MHCGRSALHDFADFLMRFAFEKLQPDRFLVLFGQFGNCDLHAPQSIVARCATQRCALVSDQHIEEIHHGIGGGSTRCFNTLEISATLFSIQSSGGILDPMFGDGFQPGSERVVAVPGKVRDITACGAECVLQNIVRVDDILDCRGHFRCNELCQVVAGEVEQFPDGYLVARDCPFDKSSFVVFVIRGGERGHESFSELIILPK